jgi:acetyltransferase-like isoleucine patch superfamily enzyme
MIKNKNERDTQISSSAKFLGDVTIGENVIIHDFVTIYPEVIIKDNTEIFEGAVIGKPPKRTISFSRKISSNKVVTIIGEECIISPNAIIYNNVEIGNHNLIGDNTSIREQCIIGNECIIGRNVTLNYNVLVGNSTRILDGSVITGNMIIGNNVFISASVATANDNKMGKKDYEDDLMKGPIIEDNVAIGVGAIILPSIRIGEGSIVGAGAVVTKDVPKKRLIMGVPAKIIRKLD